MDGHANALCVECEQPTQSALRAYTGAPVCAGCAAAYYTHCTACQLLLPQDEAMTRDGAFYCAGCYAKQPASRGGATVDETVIESLVAEYVQLHAEEKRLSERMNEIKEAIKAFADTKQRASNAVVLRAGDAAVKCSYKVVVKYDQEKLAALESLLGESAFATLFERRVSYAPVKDKIEEIIRSTDEANAPLREALERAAERVEVASITVVPKRK
jgi:hypothetical protein